MSDKLNARQKAFCDAYLLEPHGTKAAIAAGYAKGSAEVTASKLLRMPKILKYLSECKAEREEATKIDAAWVLTNLANMIQADPVDIINQETGAYKPIHDWPIVWRRMLSAADVKELYAYDDGDREKIGEIVKYKFIDKLKAFELLGKHVDVSAFAERHIHEVSDLADRITRSRNRTIEQPKEKSLH